MDWRGIILELCNRRIAAMPLHHDSYLLGIGQAIAARGYYLGITRKIRN